MRHRKAGKKLSMRSAHRRSVIRNQLTSLIIHERIQTTHAKSKVLKREIDKLITLGKKGTLHARRLAAGRLYGHQALKKLFEELVPRYANRKGGYCRTIPFINRRGDAAPITIVELIPQEQGITAKRRMEAQAQSASDADTRKER